MPTNPIVFSYFFLKVQLVGILSSGGTAGRKLWAPQWFSKHNRELPLALSGEKQSVC